MRERRKSRGNERKGKMEYVKEGKRIRRKAKREKKANSGNFLQKNKPRVAGSFSFLNFATIVS